VNSLKKILTKSNCKDGIPQTVYIIIRLGGPEFFLLLSELKKKNYLHEVVQKRNNKWTQLEYFISSSPTEKKKWTLR
jgi:hypothetical protein